MAEDHTMVPLRRISLRSFLSSAKSLLANPTQQKGPLTFVVGNESADLDSLTSAITLAYLRTYSPKPPREKGGIYIPLSNLHREELRLRPELGPVLQRANLSIQDLITLDELPGFSPSRESSARERLEPKGTRWVLVDHNVLQGELGEVYGGGVVGVVDHHEDEGKYTDVCGEEGRVIQVCGSCASLVVTEWDATGLLEASGSDGGEAQRVWDRELAEVVLAPIAIDTSNLQSKQKTTDVDREAVLFLESVIRKSEAEVQTSGTFDRDAYFEEVAKAKGDIGGLGLRDILRKDYKQWDEAGVKLGISSVVKNLDFLISKAGSEGEFLKAVEAWAKERELGVVSVMTTSHGEVGFKRELLVWGVNEKGMEIVKKFESESGEKLGLKVWKKGVLDAEEENGYRKSWHQEKVECSRKQVAPLLRDAMQ